MRKAALANILGQRIRLLELLTTFYRGRHVPYDHMLTLQDMEYVATLESQGAQFQVLESPERRAQKLLEYRQEWQAFTDFLKETCFAQVNVLGS